MLFVDLGVLPTFFLDLLRLHINVETNLKRSKAAGGTTVQVWTQVELLLRT